MRGRWWTIRDHALDLVQSDLWRCVLTEDLWQLRYFRAVPCTDADGSSLQALRRAAEAAGGALCCGRSASARRVLVSKTAAEAARLDVSELEATTLSLRGRDEMVDAVVATA
jgi:hypothetical protein